MKNPFLSLWLSQANTYASVTRAFWAGELRRQQIAMTKALTAGPETKRKPRRKSRGKKEGP